jgi:dienelactone hydrolase
MSTSAIAAVLLASACSAGQTSAAELSKLDVRVFKPGSAEAKEAPDLVAKYLRARRDELNRASLAWKLDTRADWEKLRDEKIANLRAAVARFPDAPKHVASHVSKTLPGEGFAIDNVVYESRPGFWVTANLYRPEPLPRSAAAIIIVHSHHNPKTQGELQDMGMLWARAGCYVLVPDMLGHGERREHPFHTEKDYTAPYTVGRQDYFFRYNTGLQLSLIGDSLAGWMAWDLMRGVDVLLQKPAIDPRRIAIFGSVAGGGDPAALTAALDPRISVVAPFNFGGPQPETKFPLPDNAEEAFNYIGGGSWESTRNLRDTGLAGFFPWVMVASVAPRAIIHAHEFAWDRDRDPAWRRYQKIMDFYGAGDKLAFTHGRGSVKGTPPESTHCNNIGLEHRKMMHPALNKWFDIKAEEYSKRLPSSDLQCWTPELRAKLQPQPLHEVAAELASQRQKEEQRRLDVTLKGWGKSFAVTGERRLRDVPAPGPARTGVLISQQGSLPVPITVLNLPDRDAAEVRMVLCLAQQGREAFLKHRAEALAQLTALGVTIVLVDLPGCGETRSGDGRGRTSYATSVSSTAQLLGTSLLDIRMQALAEVLHSLKQAGAQQKLRIALWGDSFAGVNEPAANLKVPYDIDVVPKQGEPLGGLLALLAPLLTDVPIAGAYIHGGLASYRSLLEGPFLYIPHDTIEPGFLAQMDLDDLARRFAPRPLRMEGLIDGLNRTATEAAVKASYPRTNAAYQTQPQSLHVAVRRSSDAEIATWLTDVLKGK